MNLENKTILVTGGTGSFGQQIVGELAEKTGKIVVFSRDEWKQHKMKDELEDHKNIDFIIGDVRDYHSIAAACRDVDIIYHAAAMKHVPICEEFPVQAIKTNTLGAVNVRRAAIENGIEKVVVISTDKAVNPVNVMGMTKALQEKIMLSNRNTGETKFICVRFGNVIGSRGSVVPLFKSRLERNKPLVLTHKNMKRFFISLDDSIELVLKATREGGHGQIFVKKMPVCRIADLANVMVNEIAKNSTYPINYTGPRQGEQLDETLVSETEINHTVESDDFYIIYPYGSGAMKNLYREIDEYSTKTEKRIMSYEDIKQKLENLGWLK